MKDFTFSVPTNIPDELKQELVELVTMLLKVIHERFHFLCPNEYPWWIETRASGTSDQLLLKAIHKDFSFSVPTNIPDELKQELVELVTNCF